MSQEPSSEPASDPALDEEANRALRPYRSLIPSTDYEAFREIVRWHLATDPVAARLVKAVRSSPVVYESGDVDMSTGKPVESPQATPKGGSR